MWFFWFGGRSSPQRIFVGLAVATIVWILIYVAQGYRLGHAPAGELCYRDAKIDFVIPMYEPMPALACVESGA